MATAVSHFWFNPTLQRLSEAPLADSPLPLQRFCAWRGAPNPVLAMQGLITELLSAVGADVEDEEVAAQSSSITDHHQPIDNRFVNVVDVCRHLGIRLTGAPPIPNRQAVYSLASPFWGRREISGHLRMTTEGPLIYLPLTDDIARARLAAAHEIGHYLIHWRGDKLDPVSWSLPSSPEEEELAEYAARLLLLPKPLIRWPGKYGLVAGCLHLAGARCVTLHAAALRLQDGDVADCVACPPKAVIFWRLHPGVSKESPTAHRLTPQWFISPEKFVPVKRCRAGADSLVAELAEADGGERSKEGTREEPVSIGSLRGLYRVDAFAWGSLRGGKRLVLSFFTAPSGV